MMTITKETLLDTAAKIYAEMKPDKKYDISVTLHKEKRSNDANAYLWKLCTLLADKLQITKEEVYKKEVANAGVCDIVTLKNEAVDRYNAIWQTHGIGWFTAVIDDSPLSGYKNIAAYCGTSCYNTRQMSRLINNVVEECKAQEIETLPPEELERMMSEWKKPKTAKTESR